MKSKTTGVWALGMCLVKLNPNPCTSEMLLRCNMLMYDYCCATCGRGIALSGSWPVRTMRCTQSPGLQQYTLSVYNVDSLSRLYSMWSCSNASLVGIIKGITKDAALEHWGL